MDQPNRVAGGGRSGPNLGATGDADPATQFKPSPTASRGPRASALYTDVCSAVIVAFVMLQNDLVCFFACMLSAPDPRLEASHTVIASTRAHVLCAHRAPGTCVR